MKLVITNTVALNGGDAAILMAIIELLRQQFGADAEIAVFDSQPEVAAKYYPQVQFRKLLFSQLGHGMRRRLNAKRLLSSAQLLRSGYPRAARRICPRASWNDLLTYFESDLVVSTGGTYLVEHYDLSGRLFDFELAHTVGTPLALFTQSLGPFEKPDTCRRLREVLNDAILVLVRDRKSVQHLEQLGVAKDRVTISADAAFALAEDSTIANAASRKLKIDGLRVAVSVRHWQHFGSTDPNVGMQRYLGAVATLIDHLVTERSATVTLVSSCQGIPEYWTDDSKTAAELMHLLPSRTREAVVLNRDFHTPSALLGLMGEQDLVVGTRMHIAILALCAGTPVLPISYEFKTKELFSRLGAGDFVHDIQSIDGSTLVASAERYLEELATSRAELFRNVALEKEEALNSVRLIGNRLDSPSYRLG